MDQRLTATGRADASIGSAWIHQLATQAGFDLCGFARPDPIPPETLTAWLEAGMAAEMDWMGQRALDRLDVRRLLPEARTVISLACNYYVEDGETERSPVARYARGRDYHFTLQDRLRAFRRALQAALPGIGTYGSIDHGAFMEKVWAARAGIGYVGRNGCLVTERYGSYVNLAVLVIDRAVDRYADGPAVDRCGHCTLCINSCPTEAIVADATIDARRCLSYQTIEQRGPVPEALRAAFEGTVFGCDICQEVCPLNTAPIQADARFAPRAVAKLGVRELAALSREEYQVLVRGTSLGRAKYDGLRRNAIYALGALREAESAELLRRLAEDDSALVREAASWALGQIGPR